MALSEESTSEAYVEGNDWSSLTEEDVMSMTKAELKEILDDYNVEYKYADTLAVLQEKVLAII